MLGLQPYLLDACSQLDDRGAKGEEEEGAGARDLCEVGVEGHCGVRSEQHHSDPVTEEKMEADLGHPFRVCGAARARLYPEPQAVKNAGGRVPQTDPCPQEVSCLASVCGCDDVANGAEERDVPRAVEESVLEGGGGARVQRDIQGLEELA